MISIIVAVSENNAIGKENTLLWKLSNDLKRFKELTTGHAVIMGRKTYEAIGRPLPNRRNIVITRQADFHPEGVEVVHSLEEALSVIPAKAGIQLDPRVKPEDDNVFIIGGAEIYKQALPRTDRIYLTRVHQSFEGDAYFPELGPEWQEVAREEGVVDEKNPIPHTFLTLQKRI